MTRYYHSLDQWEFDGPYDEPAPIKARVSDEWDDELLDKEFDLRDEEQDDVDE